jgi:predicted GNAT family acetyltransferase
LGDVRIVRLINTDKDFYKILGPYLSKREIVKELGNNVWDDENKTWFVALKDKKVCGFVAALKQKDNIVFCSEYVMSEYRKQGIYTSLFEARLAEYLGSTIISTVTDCSLVQYLANGFTEVGKRGKYHMVKKVPN